MPIFEFKCADCSSVFEELILGGRKQNEVKCPDCGSGNIKKLISAPFLPSSVGKPANDDIAAGPCCGSSPEEKGCTPGSCCSSSDD